MLYKKKLTANREQMITPRRTCVCLCSLRALNVRDFERCNCLADGKKKFSSRREFAEIGRVCSLRQLPIGEFKLIYVRKAIKR